MSEHRLDRIDFRRPARFTAVCTCGWRSEPMLSAGLAGSLWDRHVEQRPTGAPSGQVPIVDVDLTIADAARRLHAELLPAIKDAVRADAPLTVIDAIEDMEAAAATMGEADQRLARAVRREWTRLVEEPTSRQRATVIVGLVELGERARAHLARLAPSLASHPDR